jgi:hypothetical protein
MTAASITLPLLTVEDVIRARTTPEDIQEPIGGKYTFPGFPIFTYGSNFQGIDGAGAARVAGQHWNRPRGFGTGFQSGAPLGTSTPKWGTYAIATKESPHGDIVPLYKIQDQLNDLFNWASQEHVRESGLLFLVTALGCGLAGYSPMQVAPLCGRLAGLPNVWLPKTFWTVLRPRLVVERIAYNPPIDESPFPTTLR